MTLKAPGGKYDGICAKKAKKGQTQEHACRCSSSKGEKEGAHRKVARDSVLIAQPSSEHLPDSFVLSENIEARIAGAASLALFVLTALLKSSGRRRACFASAVYRPPSLAVK